MKKLDLDGFDRPVPLVCDVDGTLINKRLSENFFEALVHSAQRLLCTIPSQFMDRMLRLSIEWCLRHGQTI
ncbi:hypothetical protein [Rhizobium mongolense]|uniref:Uncharacterized protein n=1 Tax=Rhizobium mongolense TaxID=57676 RepID=A0A7W6RT87_9HYPH|nr:hypothetical protein [Rhizobium mongolense]MBB4277666.1 hypothetical protein [Rhizobium mongolense]